MRLTELSKPVELADAELSKPVELADAELSKPVELAEVKPPTLAGYTALRVGSITNGTS